MHRHQFSGKVKYSCMDDRHSGTGPVCCSGVSLMHADQHDARDLYRRVQAKTMLLGSSCDMSRRPGETRNKNEQSLQSWTSGDSKNPTKRH